MVKRNFWIDAKYRNQTPAQRDSWITGTVTEQVSDGMLAVALDGTPDEWPDVVAPADPGVFALGASVRLLRDSTGRVIQIAAPNELPEGVDTFPVGFTGKLMGQIKAAQSELDTAMQNLDSEIESAKTNAQSAADDATAALIAASGAVTDTVDEFAATDSPTVPPSEGWSTTAPEWVDGRFIWKRTRVTKGDGAITVTDAVPVTGNSGADALSLVIASSVGNIFRNSEGSATLTVSVFKGPTLLTDTQVSALGTLKWYKDGGTTSVGSGKTLTVTAASIVNKAVYTCKLEG